LLVSYSDFEIENSRGKLSFSSLSRQALYQNELKFCHPQPATGSKPPPRILAAQPYPASRWLKLKGSGVYFQHCLLRGNYKYDKYEEGKN